HARQRRHHRRQQRSTAHNIPRHISERSRRTNHTERGLRRRLSRTNNRGLGPFRGHASSPPDSPLALRTSVLSHLMSLATLNVSSSRFSTLAASSSSIGNTLPLSKSYASFATLASASAPLTLNSSCLRNWPASYPFKLNLSLRFTSSPFPAEPPPTIPHEPR